ncbi:MAG: outer membrane lipoprotein-sorting protein [Acidobacteriia bacterium]|nr:outer membrane lipoprotein-sorting protein [Terriglobia bacterium]
MRPSLPSSRSLVFVLLAAGIAGTSTTRLSRTQDKPPAAEEILERFIRATGGRPAYEKLHNQIIMGAVEFVESGIKGKTAEYKTETNKAYRVVDLEGVGKIEAGTDGSVAWERSSETGARIKSGEERATALREATFNAALHWRDLYSKSECVSSEKVGDQLCFKVVLTPKEGKPVTQYYDERSGLLVKMAMTTLTPTMGEIAVETYLSDYRNVEGILVPHELRRKVLSQQIDTHIESVQFNAEIPKTSEVVCQVFLIS